MSAIREVVELESGIVVGTQVFFDVMLRPATLADTYRATERVPVPDDLTSKAARIAYQVQVDDAVVLCQVCALDDQAHDLPDLLALANQIEPDDMALLRAAAARVKKKLQLSRKNSLISDAPSASSLDPASP